MRRLRLSLCLAVAHIPVVAGIGCHVLVPFAAAALVHLQIVVRVLQMLRGRILEIVDLELVLQSRRWLLPVKAVTWRDVLAIVVPVVPRPQWRLVRPGGKRRVRPARRRKRRRPGRSMPVVCPPPAFAKPELHCWHIRDLAGPLQSGQEGCHHGAVCHEIIEAGIQWDIQIHLAEEAVQIRRLAEVAFWHTQQYTPAVVCSSCVWASREVLHGDNGHAQCTEVRIGDVWPPSGGLLVLLPMDTDDQGTHVE